MTESGYSFEYVILTEKDAGHHVVIRRQGSPWLQKIATFESYERALSYSDCENDCFRDDEMLADPSRADVGQKAPSSPEPPSAISVFLERVAEVGRLQEDARIEGREEARIEAREDIKALANAVVAKIDPTLEVVEPALEPNHEPLCQPEPPKPATPIKPSARNPSVGQSERTIAVDRIKKTIVADLDALMEQFPRGPTTNDLREKYGYRNDWLGEALRQAHDAGLLRYEMSRESTPTGKRDPNKYVWPVGYKAPTEATAPPAPSAPAPGRSPPRRGTLTDFIIDAILSQFDRLGPFSLPEIAKLAGESLVETRVACEELDAAGRAKFVTIDRAVGRQLVPTGWEPPKKADPINASDDELRAAPAALIAELSKPAQARAKALTVSSAAHALADFQRERTKPRVPVVAIEKRAIFGETGAVSLNYKPDAPIEQRDVVSHTAELCGDPAPGRSALATKKPAPPAPPRRRDEPISIEDYLRGGR